MIIKNADSLGSNPLRKKGLAIIEAGLDAIDTHSVISKSVKYTDGFIKIKGLEPIDLSRIKNIFIVGVGKCAEESVFVMESILSERLTGGVVIGVGPSSRKFERVKYFAGSHPIPSEKNVDASRAIVDILEKTTSEDLVIFCVSGGGSTLLCLPKEPKTCVDEKQILEKFFKEGAPIEDINTVRKHTSLVRGGYLAKYAYPAKVVSLIFSDIPGGSIKNVASGPTVLDETTIDDAMRVLEKYGIGIGENCRNIGVIETPKDKKYFSEVQNVCLVSNKDALMAMKKEAESKGFKAKICSTCLSGQARDVGRQIIEEVRLSEEDCLLFGGETTVFIKGEGKGGRNQECVLGALRNIKEGELLISCASDGIDNTSVAGAIADMETLQHSKKNRLDINKFLSENNSYAFFKKSGDAIVTGPTGSNVSDLLIALKL